MSHTGKRDCAVFTIQQNEDMFLPIWLEYYARHFFTRDIYILDHNTTSEKARCGLFSAKRGYGANVVNVHLDHSFNHTWLKNTVSAFQRFLLQSYDMVLFTEIDEIVALNPAMGLDLQAFLATLRDKPSWQYMKFIGHEIIHHVKANEPAIDLRERPLLKQRNWWAPSLFYSKPLLSKVPLDWHDGFHDIFNRPPFAYLEEPLHLLHLHRLDFDSCRARHESNLKRKWSEEDVRKGAGFQNRIIDRAELLEWYYNPSYEKLNMEEIPERWKEII